MIEANGVDHVLLHVGDVRRSKKFYTEILGVTVYRETRGRSPATVKGMAGS